MFFYRVSESETFRNVWYLFHWGSLLPPSTQTLVGCTRVVKVGAPYLFVLATVRGLKLDSWIVGTGDDGSWAM